MKKKVEYPMTHPHAFEAANEEFPATEAGSRASGRDHATGWDPYEVWLTRVKESPERSMAEGGQGR